MTAESDAAYNILMPTLSIWAGLSIASFVLLWVKRSWPPLHSKNLPLMGLTIIFGSVWAVVPLVTIAPVRPWENCEITESIVTHGGSAIWVPALYIRFQSLESVLIHHDANVPNPLWRLFKLWLMVPLGHTMLMIQYPWIGLEWANYDEELGDCPDPPTPFPPDGSGWEWLQIVFALRPRVIRLLPYFYLYSMMIRAMWRLKNVRSQFNEFRETAVSLAFSFGGFLPIALGLSTIPTVLIYFFTVQVMYWGIVGVPLYHLIKGDKEYLHKFTYGFDEMPTAEMLTANLENQLAVPAVREQFRKFAGKRFAVENLDFYEACLARDQLTEWFERQAQTMKVIDTFIVPGAPKEVNIPDSMRQDIFSGNVNDIDLFEAAKREIMQLMTTNMGDEFAKTKEMIGLKESAAEMERLRKLAYTRGKSHVDVKRSTTGISKSSSSSGMGGRASSRFTFSTSSFGKLGRRRSVDLNETGQIAAPGQVLDEETSRVNKEELSKHKKKKEKATEGDH